jgi:hypothetical protein
VASRLCGGPSTDGTLPCPTAALVHARPGSGTAARCPTCRRQWQQAKDARRPERRTHAEQQRRHQAVAAHVAVHGWWCLGLEGYDHQAHPTQDLTAHHVAAVGAGGSEHGRLVAICRSLNSEIGARTSSR